MLSARFRRLPSSSGWITTTRRCQARVARAASRFSDVRQLLMTTATTTTTSHECEGRKKGGSCCHKIARPVKARRCQLELQSFFLFLSITPNNWPFVVCDSYYEVVMNKLMMMMMVMMVMMTTMMISCDYYDGDDLCPFVLRRGRTQASQNYGLVSESATTSFQKLVRSLLSWFSNISLICPNSF